MRSTMRAAGAAIAIVIVLGLVRMNLRADAILDRMKTSQPAPIAPKPRCMTTRWNDPTINGERELRIEMEPIDGGDVEAFARRVVRETIAFRNELEKPR